MQTHECSDEFCKALAEAALSVPGVQAAVTGIAEGRGWAPGAKAKLVIEAARIDVVED